MLSTIKKQFFKGFCYVVIGIFCLSFFPIIAKAASYSITVPMSVGSGTQYTLSNANPQEGETVTVTVSSTSGQGASGVNFLNDSYSVINIVGYPILRSYDNPNQFTFVMPAQDVKLQVACAAKPTLSVNTFWEIPTGTATPPSEDGTIAAVTYTCTGKTMGDLFYNSTAGAGMTEFLYKFSDGGNYGTVSFASGRLVYTPNTAAANKKVTICVKGVAGGAVSQELQFPVNVGAVPNPNKNNDISLTKLTYSIANGVQNVEIPLVEDTYTYTVTCHMEQ